MLKHLHFLTLLTILLSGSLAAMADSYSVSMNDVTTTMSLVSKADGSTVDVGTPEGHTYTFECAPGTYILTGYGDDGRSHGTLEFDLDANSGYDAVTGSGYSVVTVSIWASNTNEDGSLWKLGEDYTVERCRVMSRTGFDFAVTPGQRTVETKNGEEVEAVTLLKLNPDTYLAYLVPSSAHAAEGYLENWSSGTSNYNIDEEAKLPKGAEFKLTVPTGATAFVGDKVGNTHYIKFKEFEPINTEINGDKTTYTYMIPDIKNAMSARNYNYRVTMPGCMTHAALFTLGDTGGKVEVTEDEMHEYPNTWFDRTFSKSKADYASIWLNINNANHLKLKPGEEFNLLHLRHWQLTNDVVANYFLEPDYNYTILNTNFEPDNSVLEIDEYGYKGIIRAKAPGTAIVQVNYDAMKFKAHMGDTWSALWADNMGTFVVTVGGDESSVVPNFHTSYDSTRQLDCEVDILYYSDKEPGYKFTFKPENAVSVSLANPSVDLEANTVSYPDGFSKKNVTKGDDGTYTLLLTQGRNIVRMTDAAGRDAYHLLHAKPLNLHIQANSRLDSVALPGDKVRIYFNGVMPVCGKLAGVYNSFSNFYYEDVPDGVSNQQGANVYWFASAEAAHSFSMTIPTEDIPESMDIHKGRLYYSGAGSNAGEHRTINPEYGYNPNLSASGQAGYYCEIPDVQVPVNEFVSGTEIAVTVGESASVTPIVIDNLKKVWGVSDVTIATANKTIASVNIRNYKITGKSAGETTVTYSAGEGDDLKKIICHVTVTKVPVDSIYFKNGDNYIGNKKFSMISPDLIVMFEPSKPSVTDIIWEISDPENVSITRKSATSTQYSVTLSKDMPDGEVVITATSEDGGHQATLHLFVCDNNHTSEFRVDDTWYARGQTIELELDRVYEYEFRLLPDFLPQIFSQFFTNAFEMIDDNHFKPLIPGKNTISLYPFWSPDSNVPYSVNVVDKSSAGIDMVGSDDTTFTVSPNPCDTHTNVTLPEDSRIEIYSLDGSLAESLDAQAGTTTIDVSRLRSGLYLVRAGNHVAKLIKR